MNAYQLFREDGTPTAVWACGKCHTITGKARDRHANGREVSERCCDHRCEDCQAPSGEWRRFCAVCDRRRQERRYRERMAAATRLDTWDGWVFWKDQGWNRGFFQSVEALLEWHAWQVKHEFGCPPLPEFVFVCEVVPFPGLDVGDLAERCTEDLHRDAREQLSGLDELAAAVEAFNAANAALVNYTPDFGRAVRVQPVTTTDTAA